VLLIHPDAVSRDLLVGHLAELRWITASSGFEVPARFEEAPSLLVGDADHVTDLDAICGRLRAATPALRCIALAGEGRARELPNIDAVLVKPVGLDRLRKTLLREARLWVRGSGTRLAARAEPTEPVEDASDYDPDDVVTRRVRY
jgi:hypothetical protein